MSRDIFALPQSRRNKLSLQLYGRVCVFFSGPSTEVPRWTRKKAYKHMLKVWMTFCRGLALSDSPVVPGQRGALRGGGGGSALYTGHALFVCVRLR